ncbi:MAG: sulfotransferase family 2 domain-containing protein [Planctomycetota bacterium]
MPISHQHRCLFIHIPRTGGSSIERALGLFGDVEVENEEAAFGRIRSSRLLEHGFGTAFLQHLTLSELGRILPRETLRDYLTVAFVRNPWDRLVSVFSRLRSGNAPSLAERLGIDDARTISFPQFLAAARDSDHIHLRPQHAFLEDETGGLSVDFIGRFENFESNFREISRRLGLENPVPFHENRSGHAHYSSYYTDETRDLVGAWYRQDVAAFGYSFQRPDQEAPRCGYTYVATGSRFVKEAAFSAASLRAVDPDAHITLITDRPPDSPEFDHVVLKPLAAAPTVSNGKGWHPETLAAFSYRIEHLYTASPYERTFYLDADTYFYESCRGLFDLLDHFDLCMSPAPMDPVVPRLKGRPLEGCTPFNCGVIVFRKNPTSCALIRDWGATFRARLSGGTLQSEAWESDQTSFMEAWLRSPAKILSLPPVWNARIPFPISLNGAVRLVHGRHPDYDRLRTRINVSLEARSWDPASERCILQNRGLLSRGVAILKRHVFRRTAGRSP